MEFVTITMRPQLSLSLSAGLLLAFVQPLSADSVVTNDNRSAILVYQLLRDYQLVNGALPVSWQMMVDWNPSLNEPEAFIAVGRGISDSYSFIPGDQGVKFPLGRLLLINAFPISVPHPASSSGGNSSILMAGAERQMLLTRRYFVYMDGEGRLVSDWLHENKIQELLRATGITIPRPTPYYPKGPDGEYLPLTTQAVEALVRLDLTDTIPPDLLAKMQTAGTLPANFTARGPRGNSAAAANPSGGSLAPSTLAQITSSPWLGWVLAIAVALAAALYLRRQRIGRR